MSKYYTASQYADFSCFQKKERQRPWDTGNKAFVIDTFKDEWVKNDNGCIRWKYLRLAYNYGYLMIDDIVNYYLEWRDMWESLWLDAYDIQDKYIETILLKASKRGNDVYKDLLRSRFRYLDNLPQKEFFHEHDVDKSTKMLFITVTVDPKKYTVNDAWRSIAHETKIFDAKLRQKYGRFVKFRVWEAHESGYSHSHSAYYFPGHDFKVVRHTSKKKKDSNGNPKLTWRIKNKDRVDIGKMWNMGREDPHINYGVDVQAVQDTKGAFSEVKKYLTKTVFTKKGDLTNAMVCLFNKQGYWVSSINPYRKVTKAIIEGKIKKTIEARSKYISDNLDKWSSQDFIGCIWGWKVYLEAYKDRKTGLTEPNNADSVSMTLCNYNDDHPEVAYFKFRGVVSHDELKVCMPDLDDLYEIHTIPPPETRYHLGIDRPLLNFKKKVPKMFMEEFE